MIQLRAILIAFLMAVFTLPAYANTAQKTEPVIYIAKEFNQIEPHGRPLVKDPNSSPNSVAR